MPFRTGIFPIFIVLLATLCGGQTASGVGFNLNWYSTPPFPFNNIVGYPNCNVTTSVVIADFNRDGMPDVATVIPPVLVVVVSLSSWGRAEETWVPICTPIGALRP